MDVMLYEECVMCQGTGTMIIRQADMVETRRPCVCKSLRVVETGLNMKQAEAIVKQAGQLVAEVERLTTALHAAKAHPDYSYIVIPARSEFTPNAAVFGAGGWERNRETPANQYDEVWRRKRET